MRQRTARLRSLMLLVLILALVGSLAACGGEGTSLPQEDSAEEEYLQIGVTFDSFVIERWLRDREVFVSTAQDLGAQVDFQNANGDVQEQIDQIDYFIERDMDAIVVVAVDCYAMSDVIQRAKDAGIVVIAYDRLIMNADLDLYVSFDNEMVGRMMAETLVEELPRNSDIICIYGPDSDSNVASVCQGFQDVIARSTLRIRYEQSAEGWLAEAAYAGVEEAIGQGLDFAGVMCGNDDLATQAFQALSEHRMADSVCLVGQDADLAACQRIVEGTQAMTVYKPVEKLARIAAKYTVQLLQGQDLGLETAMDNGQEEVPTELVEPIKVTAENMQEVIIDGGFHLEDEVYLNVN